MNEIPAPNALPMPATDGAVGAAVGAESFRAAEIHRRVIELTKKLFGAEPQLDLVKDPEFGDCAYSVSVTASGDVPTLVELSERWHSRLLDTAEEFAGIYCLSMTPNDESH